MSTFEAGAADGQVARGVPPVAGQHGDVDLSRGLARDGGEARPAGQRLGTRGEGELLRIRKKVEDGAQDVSDAGPRQGRRVRLHRTLLQP